MGFVDANMSEGGCGEVSMVWGLVSEKEIHRALKQIINLEAIVPEPTAAAVYAGVEKLGSLKGKTVVVINTASGMKNLKEIMESYVSKPSLDPV